MTAQFTPDDTTLQLVRVPDFEDARKDVAPGYSTHKTIERLQGDITQAIAQLGGGQIVIMQGSYTVSGRKRYGYEIRFTYGQQPAVMQVAGLPMRKETPDKANQVRKQALYLVLQWLQTALTSMLFTPGYAPLVQFMLVPGQDKTVGEMFLLQSGLVNSNPSLPANGSH